MAHPFQSLREDKVERSRVSKLTGAAGVHSSGGVTNNKTVIKGKNPAAAMKVEGLKSHGRLDKFARGGAVKKGSTNVNVIIAPQGGAGGPPPLPLPPAGGAPPMAPPMAPPAPPPGMGGPPMPQRDGGRTRYAAGGKVDPAKTESMKAGTQVQHTDGKNDGANIYRSKQVTFQTGGKVGGIDDGAGSGPGRLEKITLQRKR